MGYRMKTTIELSDDLAKKAKQLAARRGTTLRAVVEQGIRQVLREERAGREFTLRDASVDGNGLQPEFRDRPWADIRDAAYEGRGN
jgi:Arc/MetJ family transcription regulator